MHTIRLSPTEHQVLADTLAEEIRSIEREAGLNDKPELLDSLRSRSKILESILKSLRSQPDLESEAVYPPSI